MRAFWGRYELCSHERDNPECDGKGIHWALLEVEIENIPGQPDAVRIVKPNIGIVDAIDVRPTVEEAKRRLSDNLRFLASDIEKARNPRSASVRLRAAERVRRAS